MEHVSPGVPTDDQAQAALEQELLSELEDFSVPSEPLPQAESSSEGTLEQDTGQEEPEPALAPA